MLPWILPFALYMGFLSVAAAVSWLGDSIAAAQAWSLMAQLWLYPVKTIMVAGALFWGWLHYTELQTPIFASKRDAMIGMAVGILVYLAWIRMDWTWAMQGAVAPGYNPFMVGPWAGGILAGVRLLGATLVVPVMEELFWRSFLSRWLISTAFSRVPVGTFTPLSCSLVVILFGLGHHLWLAGMMAGLAYHVVLYVTRRMWTCVLAHAVTNFLLGLHVLLTHQWQWW